MYGINLTGRLMDKVYANALEELIYDCGGPTAVARALGLKTQSVWDWIDKGRVPWTDLDGRTSYSETMAKLQKQGRMKAVQIRRLGLNI